MGININFTAQRLLKNLQAAQSQIQTSMKRLSSGKQLLSARDNPADFSIAHQLTQQIRGLDTLNRMLNFDVTQLQEAQATASEQLQILLQMQDLAQQSAFNVPSHQDRDLMDKKFQALQEKLSVSTIDLTSLESTLGSSIQTQSTPVINVDPLAPTPIPTIPTVPNFLTTDTNAQFFFEASDNNNIASTGTDAGSAQLRKLAVEVSGTTTLIDLPYNGDATTVQTAINNITGIDQVQVTKRANTGVTLGAGTSIPTMNDTANMTLSMTPIIEFGSDVFGNREHADLTFTFTNATSSQSFTFDSGNQANNMASVFQSNFASTTNQTLMGLFGITAQVTLDNSTSFPTALIDFDYDTSYGMTFPTIQFEYTDKSGLTVPEYMEFTLSNLDATDDADLVRPGGQDYASVTFDDWTVEAPYDFQAPAMGEEGTLQFKVQQENNPAGAVTLDVNLNSSISNAAAFKTAFDTAFDAQAAALGAMGVTRDAVANFAYDDSQEIAPKLYMSYTNSSSAASGTNQFGLQYTNPFQNQVFTVSNGANVAEQFVARLANATFVPIEYDIDFQNMTVAGDVTSLSIVQTQHGVNYTFQDVADQAQALADSIADAQAAADAATATATAADQARDAEIEFIQQAQGLSVQGINVASQGAATQSLITLDQVMSDLELIQAQLAGAQQSRLFRSGAHLQSQLALQDSVARITDLDFAAEIVRYAKAQILQTTSAAMLAQANQIPALALRLFE
jgi:flagellin-like hook-associated protein FlgL